MVTMMPHGLHCLGWSCVLMQGAASRPCILNIAICRQSEDSITTSDRS